jgi:hypothetical protein
MRLLGTSAEGSWAILVLSSIVLALLTVFAYHGFVLNGETGVFLALIILCAVRLAWPHRNIRR